MTEQRRADMFHAICTDRGNVKKINQDSAIYKEAETGTRSLILAAVCDGMGGLQNGEVASGEMITALSGWFSYQLPLLLEKGITDYALIESLNMLVTDEDERITEYGEEHGECGTTLAAVTACGGKYLCINVGDSRVYRITEGNIIQLTHDQTVVQQLIDQGRITTKQAEIHPDRNVLLQCIGAGGDVVPDYSTGEYKEGDMFLICSDGFRHKLKKEEMAGIFGGGFGSDQELKEAAKSAVEISKGRKERDNITVIAVAMSAESP